jgi:hypothetical protein
MSEGSQSDWYSDDADEVDYLQLEDVQPDTECSTDEGESELVAPLAAAAPDDVAGLVQFNCCSNACLRDKDAAIATLVSALRAMSDDEECSKIKKDRKESRPAPSTNDAMMVDSGVIVFEV